MGILSGNYKRNRRGRSFMAKQVCADESRGGVWSYY
jgi:hypothetical protein